MGREIDIRIMNLNKWYVPKSFSMDELKQPVVLGYFDALEVRKIQIDQEEQHPFIAGYEVQEACKCKNNEEQDLADYSSQEQMLFLSICKANEDEDGICFTWDTVNQFWNDQTCPYIYLSMIHINHSGKLKHALKKIKKVFKKDYLSYVSFDYCDIVLFTHNMQISEFMIKIKQLFEVEEREEAVIFDTFSMVSFWPHFVVNQEYCRCGRLCGKEDIYRFQATINLSIRDYEQFAKWYSEIMEYDSDIVRYNMFGRHDVSIVNERANTAWLMKVMERLHDEKSRDIFWTFETYIKIPDKDGKHMTPDEPVYLKEVYEHIKKKLNEQIKGPKETKGMEKTGGLEEIIWNSGFRDTSRYLLPIYEVRDCICSIVKNSFAEEFIYCIYESFVHFISYMKKEIVYLSESGRDLLICEGEIAKGYDNYFTALNTLVNSTMHNERQFVQATAFNAVFYSVPPKILAFYNAYIYRIKQVLRDAGCKEEYTFLIYPSFSPTISVNQISLADNPPVDRILTVRISERSLYDIESVMYQMVHELAHFVGNGLRCRTIRKSKVMETLLKHIANKCRLDDETYRVLLHLVNDYMVKADIGDDVDLELCKSRYLNRIEFESKLLLQMLENSQICIDFFNKYYTEKINTDEQFYDVFLENMGIRGENQKAYVMALMPQYCDVKYTVFYNRLKQMDSYKEMKDYEKYTKLLKSAYSECYADLQMILVLAMDAGEYLSTFFMKQKVAVEDMLSDTESMLRISTVYRVMTDCAVWKEGVSGKKSGFATVIECIDEYNNDVREGTSTERYEESSENIRRITELLKKYNFENGIRFKKSSTEQIERIEIRKEKIIPYVDAAIGIYEYLLEVMQESLKEYSTPTKREMIEEVRKLVGRVLTFGDAADVFDCIEEELNYYKREGCKIQTA